MGGRYCVIFFVGLFLTPFFGSLSVESLIYTPISLLFTPFSFSTVYHRVLLHVRCKNEGRGVTWVPYNR